MNVSTFVKTNAKAMKRKRELIKNLILINYSKEQKHNSNTVQRVIMHSVGAPNNIGAFNSEFERCLTELHFEELIESNNNHEMLTLFKWELYKISLKGRKALEKYGSYSKYRSARNRRQLLNNSYVKGFITAIFGALITLTIQQLTKPYVTEKAYNERIDKLEARIETLETPSEKIE